MPVKIDEEKLKDQFVAELQALEDSGAGVILYPVRPSEAWYLLSAVQLALRHPGLQRLPAAAHWLHIFARDIQRRLCANNPTMAQIAEMGWDQSYDERSEDKAATADGSAEQRPH